MTLRTLSIAIAALLPMGALGYFVVPRFLSITYESSAPIAASVAREAVQEIAVSEEIGQALVAELETASIFGVQHIETPEAVRSVYMTSWVAGNKTLRQPIIDLIEETDINAVVIDIKDDTGRLSFIPLDPELAKLGAPQNRISDIDDLIAELHRKGVYVIGRVAVFQDPYMTKEWQSEALKKKSAPLELWGDKKGLFWFDAGSDKVHQYVFRIAEEAYARGFDEINFDYMRFPSDGATKNIIYPHSEGMTRRDVMRAFFEKLHLHMEEKGIPHSVDIFGMTAVAYDDLGIGQYLEDVVPYFDYVALMVYPSHFPATWNGLANPAEYPYEVILQSMSKAKERVVALGLDPDILRAWLQDFDLGKKYTAEDIRAQVRAMELLELDSWHIWNPRNVYNKTFYSFDME